MDFEDIYVSTQSEIVTAPDNEKYLFFGKCNADMIRDYVAVARQFVNDEYADSLERFMHSIVEQSDTDCEFCEYRDSEVNVDELETERDELLDVMNDVIAVLKKYDKKFKDKFRLQRLDIMPLMQELHKIVDEYE